jgi:predicted metal-dependent phosphoesterase TrpH
MAAHVSRRETEKGKEDAGESGTPPDQGTRPAEPRPKTKEEALREKAQVKAPAGMIIDLHVHTSPASPCSSASVDDIIQEAKRIGLEGICLTDHNHVWDADEVEDLRQKHQLLIFRGNEITTDQGDMLVFGLEKEIKGIVKLKELREEVSAVEGFIIVAHPFRGFLTFGIGKLGLTPEEAMERPLFKYVDAVEVMNCKVTRKENSFAAEVAEGLNLPATGGSDAHEVSEVGIFATRFSQVITNEKALIEALRDGSYAPIAYREEREKGKHAYGSTT